MELLMCMVLFCTDYFGIYQAVDYSPEYYANYSQDYDDKCGHYILPLFGSDLGIDSLYCHTSLDGESCYPK